MAQEASSSSSQTLDENTNPSLTRNVSLSRLNAKAPEFVPRTPTAADLSVVSPPPTSPGIIHVYPSPNPAFHPPIQSHVPLHHHHAPLQYHHHHHHHHQNPHHNYHNHHHNHDQRPFHDQKEVAVSKIVHGDPDGLTDEATQKIVNQVEYYFSDINLATTDHLMKFIHKDPEGYVPISVVVSFKKIKALVNSNSQLASILRNSTKLVVSEDGKKVKRQHPLTESDMEELQSRIIVAENLPEDHCHQNLMKVFSAVGSVKTIRTCQPQTSNGGASSASRSAKADNMSFSNKLHAFVEYESIEFAEKAALELNKEASWRNGLKVRLMRRPSQAKPASQARGKKADHEDEVVHKEDDTSTSERHPLNEKLVNDPHQQSDVQLHEHQQAEDQPNEKEGVGHNKKGRNRARGKGRGRTQYNNRGTHVVTPPASNSINNDHPIIGKQPPGPRMPDGTRGFAMGRGKPISVPIESSIS